MKVTVNESFLELVQEISPSRTQTPLSMRPSNRSFGGGGKTLLSKGKNTEDLVDILMSWGHSGLNVFCGPRIYPRDEKDMENLARYIMRASFSHERMTYVPEESKVIYQSKACPRAKRRDGREEKPFDALEWLAAICSHIPNKEESRINAGFVTMATTGTSPVEDGKRETMIL